MGEQLSAQVEGECLDPVAPPQRRVGEPVVVDPAEQLLDQAPQHGCLAGEVRVDTVGRNADAGCDAADGDVFRTPFGEQGHRRVEDRLLAERPAGTGADAGLFGQVELSCTSVSVLRTIIVRRTERGDAMDSSGPRAANLAVRFALELCMLAALGYTGFQLGDGIATGTALAVALPLAAAIVWGVAIAP